MLSSGFIPAGENGGRFSMVFQSWFVACSLHLKKKKILYASIHNFMVRYSAGRCWLCECVLFFCFFNRHVSKRKKKHTHTKGRPSSCLKSQHHRVKKQTTAYRAPTVTWSSACLQSTKSGQKVLRCFIPEQFLFLIHVISREDAEAAGCILIPVTPPQQSRRHVFVLLKPTGNWIEGKAHLTKQQLLLLLLLLPLKTGRHNAESRGEVASHTEVMEMSGGQQVSNYIS